MGFCTHRVFLATRSKGRFLLGLPNGLLQHLPGWVRAMEEGHAVEAVDVVPRGVFSQPQLPAAAATRGKDSAAIVDDDRVSPAAGNVRHGPHP